ncbi:hypothetical protein [Meiothermus cerbereus]|jgi:hypothetical protein|uniref:hypothetical protein n=1 Tax=Meiothermus cerbereus TaxID=65552 RepID=UPI000487DA7F|nr:hypothetical protein [Meiothermus cerbereus]
MTQKPSQIYVVRIWFEPSPEGEVWRASVSQGEERHYFADVNSLTTFLKQEIEAEEEEAPE